MVVKEVIDGLIYDLLTAGVFGWLWPEIVSHVSVEKMGRETFDKLGAGSGHRQFSFEIREDPLKQNLFKWVSGSGDHVLMQGWN